VYASRVDVLGEAPAAIIKKLRYLDSTAKRG
jgi:hypothetical protein